MSRATSAFFSLGFSCQTRFSIDVSYADFRRYPYDFNISTKAGVLESLRTRGASFQHALGEGTVFKMPLDGHEGLQHSGVYFWHDYAVEKNGSLVANWTASNESVNQKYRYLWEEFTARVSEPDQKIFLVTNSQINLPGFAADQSDFDVKFGLDAEYFRALTGELDELGAQNYKIMFGTRTIEEAVALQRNVNDPRLIVRFVGELGLKTNQLVASSFVHGTERFGSFDVTSIAGRYENSAEIIPSGNDTALIVRNGAPWGQASVMPGGYLFVFPGREKVMTAVATPGGIKFSNRTAWGRVSA